MTETYESKCLLASKCKKAGDPFQCTKLCYAFRKTHGESEVGGVYGLADIPKKYHKARVSNLPFAKQNPEAFAVVVNYIEDIVPNVDEGIGFYFYSVPNSENPKGTGTGKTTSACTIANEYIVERVIQHMKKEREIDEIPVKFVRVSEFQNVYNAMFRGTKEMQEEASRRFYTLKKMMGDTDLLVLDDIALRGATEAFTNEIYEILDKRNVEEKAVILTSNEPLEKLSKILSEQIVSRIKGMTIQISFKGEDMRRGGVL